MLAAFAHEFADINPNNSNLDATDPDGASMGRFGGLANVAGDTNTYYGASEFGGLYKTTNQGLNWFHLEGHTPLTTWDVEVDPQNTDRVYATSFYDGRVDPITGIQVSTDAGVTWQHPETAHADPALEGTANDNTPQAGYNAIAARRNEPAAYGISIRRDDPTNVAIGTNAGVAITTDSGLAWQIVDPTPGTPATNVWDAVWQPGGPQGTLDIVGDDGHLRSVDGGATWTANNLPGAAFGASGSSIFIDASPDESYVLYVAGVDNQLYESLDAGATWTQIGATDPVRGGGRVPFAMINDTTAGFDLWTGGVSLYRVVGTTPANPAPGGASRISPGGNSLAAAPAGWFGGFTRGQLGAATGAHDDVGDIVFDGSQALDAVPRIFSNDGGVYYAQTTSAAPTGIANLVWEQPNVGPHAEWVFGFAGVDQPGDVNEDIYYGTQDIGSLANTQAGATFTNNNWNNQDCCDVFDVAADDDTVLYSFGSVGGTARPFRLFLGGQNMAGGSQINTYPGNVAAAAVAAASGGTVTTFNNGESIVNFADDAYAVLMNDSGAFGDGGLHITMDITANPIVWTELGNATEPASNNFGDLQVANNGGTPSFFVTVGDGNGYTSDQLWRFNGTNPAGAWQRLDTNIGAGGGVNIFGVDPNNANRLYASFIDPVTGPRMVVSADGGTTWNNDTNLDVLMTGSGAFQYQVQRGPRNFPYQEDSGSPARGVGVYYQPTMVVFDPEDTNNIVAGSMDAGVFFSDDAGATWRLITDPFGDHDDVPHLQRARFAHFDHDDPSGLTEVFVGTQGRGVWRVGVDFEKDPDEYDADQNIVSKSNDTIGTATVLGSVPEVTLNELSIHNDTDRDFFKITANQTGKLAINMMFDGLLGDLDIRVRDAAGNIIDVGTQTNIAPQIDNEKIVIPVVGQETYFIEVFSAVGHTNCYDLEIENFAAPVPSGVHLDPASDSGTLNNDHITNDDTPRFIVQADLTGFNDMGISILSPTEADAMLAGTGTTPGAAVEVFATNSTTGASVRGFADQIGASTLLFDFTPAAIAEGVYFVSAAVRIFDGQQDGNPAPATGRSQVSEPLWVTVDTTAPLKEIGDPGAGKSGLHPDSDSGVAGEPALFADRITNDTTPTLFGRAEAGSVIRGFVLDNGGAEVPIGVAVAIPDTGNNSTLNGEWTLTSNLHLNDPLLSLSLDGLRTIRFRAEDIAGNVTEDMELTIFIDTQGPQISNVQITGSPAFDLFDVKPSQGPTPVVNSLSISVQDLPDRVAAFLYNALHEDANGNPVENAGNYLVVGDHDGIVAIDSVAFTPDAPVAGSPATGTIQINFAEPLLDDRFTLTISDAIADPAGNALDGDSDASQPNGGPTFPSGDAQPGGGFTARFTVDSRAEIGIWAAGSVYVDTNGNFSFDPQGSDSSNQDLVYTLGFTTDNVFAGNFVEGAGDNADGFDKVASYGRVAGSFRWLVDVNNDSVIDLVVADPAQQNGLPVAGNFDGNTPNGDEVGLKDDVVWYLDTDHNFMVDTTITGDMVGYPFVGDFDGDGVEDLGAWADDTFSLDLSTVLTGAAAAGSYDANINGFTDIEFRFGFPGVRERPFAADFDGDGHDDIGLWAPDRSGAVPAETGEWYIFISGGDPLTNRIELNGGGVHGNPDLSNENYIPFTPTPFGNDVFARFGDDFALPVVGNFDPPVTTRQIATTVLSVTNPEDPLDVNGDGFRSPVDALWLINKLNEDGSTALEQVVVAADYQELASGAYLDPSGDGFLSPLDPLMIINALNERSISAADGEGDAAEVVELTSSQSFRLPFINESPELLASEGPRPSTAAAVAGEGESKVSDDFGWQVSADERHRVRRAHLPADDELESLLDDLADDVALAWTA